MGTGEMTQKLRAFAAHPEDLRLSLSGYMVSHNCRDQKRVSELDTLFWSLPLGMQMVQEPMFM